MTQAVENWWACVGVDSAAISDARYPNVVLGFMPGKCRTLSIQAQKCASIS
jgi:hypothetical protein